MRNKYIFQTLIAGLLVILFSGAVFAKPLNVKKTAQGIPFVSQEILVKFNKGIADRSIKGLNSQHGVSILAASRPGGFLKLRVPKGKSEEEMVKIYNRLPQVEYAELNTVCRSFASPNDQYYSYQWHLRMINMEKVWDDPTAFDEAPAGSRVVVAVLDTGVDESLSDLAQTVFVPGINYIEVSEPPIDRHGHGTHVTGTVAQSTNNSHGVAGVASFTSSIMPVKVLDDLGYGSADSLANGIYWATDNGAGVINMSLGWEPGVDPGSTLADAVNYAFDRDVVLIAASGNGGVGTISYPALYPHVISVGAVTLRKQRAGYSQYGADLDVVAPGGDYRDRNRDGFIDGVLQQTFDPNTPDPNDPGKPKVAYFFFVGTSMATPHVSGLASLLLFRNPAVTPEDIRQILHETAKDLGTSGRDQFYGYGLIDAYAALNFSSSPPPPPTSNQPPVADAGPNKTVTDNDGSGSETVNLDGSASTDADGSIVSYEWREGGAVLGVGNTPALNHSFAVGDHTVTLIVTDNEGATDLDTVQITVRQQQRALSVEVHTADRYKNPQDSFSRSERVYVQVLVDVEGVQTAGATVQVDVVHDGEVVKHLDGTTNASGEYFKAFKLSRKAPAGAYSVNISTRKGGYIPATGSTVFQLTQ